MRIRVHTASAAVRRTLEAIVGASGHHLTTSAENTDLLLVDSLHPESKTIPASTATLPLVTAANSSEHAITCPFRPQQLIQRLMSLGNTQTIMLGNGWILDMQARMLSRGVDELTLTEKECVLLKHLAYAHPRALTRENLLEQVWGIAGDADSHTVETHIYRLRTKLTPLVPPACDIATNDGAYQLVVSEVQT